MYNINPKGLTYKKEEEVKKIISNKELASIIKFFVTYQDKKDKCVRGFAKICREYSDAQIQEIIEHLPIEVRVVLEENSKEYLEHAKVSVKNIYKQKTSSLEERNLNISESRYTAGGNVIIPNQTNRKGILKKNNN